jgi:hypothetical protein
MKLFMNHLAKENGGNMNDRVAAGIAKWIIGLQRCLALRLNHWFNALSTVQKKWVLACLAMLVSALLISGLSGAHLQNLNTVDYSSAHIGEASGAPLSQNKQLTDSITIKNRSWKEQK